MTATIGDWAWWSAGDEPVRVIDVDDLWGTRVVDVVRTGTGAVARVPEAELQPLAQRPVSADDQTWRACALRATALVAQGEPLATRSGRVELLPHQLSTLRRAVALDPVRLAICDEVGLGKTITAGAIISELKARGRVRRVLVIAPKGVQLQWVAEMSERFGEDFVRVGPEGLPVDSGVDPWRAFDRVVASLDAVKPVRARAGWTHEQVAAYNALRFRAVVDAGWDLVVIDEAHHVAGSSDDVARHRLARALAQTAPDLLLLSATPHSGRSENFRRFLGLVDDAFLHGRPIDRLAVAEIVARTDKRGAVDNAGRPLFRGRRSTLEVVRYGDHTQHRALYEAVSEYVRTGYGHAVRTGKTATGFLLLLMQRLVASSTPAILTALERRLAALSAKPTAEGVTQDSLDDWSDLTGDEQLDAVDRVSAAGWDGERLEVRNLVDLARTTHASSVDPKALHLLGLLRRLESEEGASDVKLVVFTEFRPTQDLIVDLLGDAGIGAVVINGSMGLAERAVAQAAFRDHARVLVSTDAGGEGINLQFAHVVVNWDMPWTPTKIEQRVGRVDRIGQPHDVKAFNLVLEDSVDARVLEVLERKLETILLELGVDKRSDVLESASRHTDTVYARAILDPGTVEAAADALERDTVTEVREHEDVDGLLAVTAPAPPPPGGANLADILRRAAAASGRRRGTRPADPAEALVGLPAVAPGEPIATYRGETAGWWVCVEVRTDERVPRATAFALFRRDTGAVDPHAADRMWTRLMDGEEPAGTVALVPEIWRQLQQLAIDYAYAPYKALTGVASGAPLVTLRLAARLAP